MIVRRLSSIRSNLMVKDILSCEFRFDHNAASKEKWEREIFNILLKSHPCSQSYYSRKRPILIKLSSKTDVKRHKNYDRMLHINVMVLIHAVM